MRNKKVMEMLKKMAVTMLTVFMMVSVMPTSFIKAEGETETVYTLYYHKNDGTDEVINKTYTDNSVLETDLFQIENKLLTEWNTQDDGKGTAYSLDSTIKDVFKEETEIHLYATWSDVRYTVQFKDLVDGKENLIQEMKSDQLKVKLPQPNIEQHKEEVFKGWKSSIDEELYQADAEVDVTADMSFTAVWEDHPVAQEKAESKSSKLEKVVYFRDNSTEDEQTLEVTDNLTEVANYPAEQFLEDGQVKRNFLYWSTSKDAYIDDSLTKIYPGADLDDFNSYVRSGKLDLYAIYDNEDEISIEYHYYNNGEVSYEMSLTSFAYEIAENMDGITLKNVDILDGSKFDDVHRIFKNWYRSGSNTIDKIGFVEQLDIPVLYEYDIRSMLINGYISFGASFRAEGIRIKYEIGNGVGNAPVDNNIYGVGEGLTHTFTFEDGDGLTKGERGKVIGWNNARFSRVYPIGNRYSADDFLSNVADYVNEEGVVHFYPIYEDAYCLQFDVSDSPISIGRPDDITTFSDTIDLPNLDNQFKDSDEYFVGWEDENGEIFTGTVKLDSEDYIHKFRIVTAKKTTFKVKYDCSEYAEMACPIDENEYTIGDTIYVGNAAEKDIVKDNTYFEGWKMVNASGTFLNEDISFSSYHKDVKNGILILKPYRRVLDYANQILYQNTTDDVRSFRNVAYGYDYEDRSADYLTYNMGVPMLLREGYYLEGWSTKPDKNDSGAKFYSYWEDYQKPTSSEPLYAQWISIEDVKRSDEYAYITLQRDLGHGESIEKSVYVKKGTVLNQGRIAYSIPSFNEEEEDEMTAMFNELFLFWNKEKIKDKNGNLDPVVSENNAVYEIVLMNCEKINFISAKEGTLIDNNGNEQERIETKYEDGFCYHYIENIPSVKPNRGYSFVGWDIFPYFEYPVLPASLSLENIQSGNGVISTEDLNNFFVKLGNLNANKSSTSVDHGDAWGDLYALNIYPVFEPISKATGEVQYYYDGMKDEEATESIATEFYVGEKLEDYKYKDKIKDNYEFDKVEGLPLTFDEDASKNVIKVYYVRNKTTAKVEYYYDGKLDEEATEILSDQKAGAQLKEYPEKLKDGYELDRTENLPLTLNEDATKNVIKVYYVKKKEPTKPTTPEQPSKPGKPEKPSNPQSQDPKPSTDTKKKPVAGVKTGDRTNMNIWIGVCMLSIATMAGIMFVSKKKKKKE